MFEGTGYNTVPANAFLRGEGRAFLVGAAVAIVGTVTLAVGGSQGRGTEGACSFNMVKSSLIVIEPFVGGASVRLGG
jgi:hypothetical protein